MKITPETCIAVYDAVSRANLTRDVKTPAHKEQVVREAIETAAKPEHAMLMSDGTAIPEWIINDMQAIAVWFKTHGTDDRWSVGGIGPLGPRASDLYDLLAEAEVKLFLDVNADAEPIDAVIGMILSGPRTTKTKIFIQAGTHEEPIALAVYKDMGDSP